jgi:hypothetical protein
MVKTNSTHGKMRNISVNPQRAIPLGRQTQHWEDNIKKDVKYTIRKRTVYKWHMVGLSGGLREHYNELPVFTKAGNFFS